jgi:hypothetical protein
MHRMGVAIMNTILKSFKTSKNTFFLMFGFPLARE